MKVGSLYLPLLELIELNVYVDVFMALNVNAAFLVLAVG